METGQITEKSISDANFRGIWQRLTHNQQRFAVAMLNAANKKDAALAIGVEPDTVYRWNGEIDAAVAYMRDQARDAAIEILTGQAVKAAMVKVAGLDSNDEIRRQDAASEVLDRVLGKPTQRQEVTGKDGGPIETETNDTTPVERRIESVVALLDIARARADSGGPGGDSGGSAST